MRAIDMDVYKYFDENEEAMVDVVPLEQAVQLAEEVREEVIRQYSIKLKKAVEDIDISELVTEWRTKDGRDSREVSED